MRDEFFARAMYAVDVRGWPEDLVYPPRAYDEPAPAPVGASLTVAPLDPRAGAPLPPPQPETTVLRTDRFTLRNSGNRTLNAPKRSWKAELDRLPGPDGDIVGMVCVNMKAMYNDPCQMREALAWRLFRAAGVPASRHTYARFGINGRHLGLFSMIEQVDRSFLADRFPGRPRGNLYKVGCGQIGCGSLEHRVGPDGDDGGRQYQNPPGSPSNLESDATYRLRSFSRAGDAESFEDLATLVRVINGVGLPGGDERFDTDEFATRVGAVLDVEPFLRWAGVNLLLGGWDNYFATPANYYLYNATHTPESGDVTGQPFFTLIPWDYDNCLGMDYFGTRWQDTDLIDWPANTEGYHRSNGGTARRSRIPLVVNLLRNTGFRRYYLDHLEHFLDAEFNPAAIDARLGRLWPRVSPSAYLESATPYEPPFTGRQYTNDEVYRAGFLHWELRHGQTFALGVRNYVQMRHDRARAQLTDLRRRDPAGSSGAHF